MRIVSIIAAAALAITAAPIPAQVATRVDTELAPLDKSKPVTIILDNRAPCFGGRIGEGRALRTRLTAEAEARRLKHEGYKVRLVTLSPGFDRTMPDDGFKTFTAIC